MANIKCVTFLSFGMSVMHLTREKERADAEQHQRSNYQLIQREAFFLLLPLWKNKLLLFIILVVRASSQHYGGVHVPES